MRLSELDFEFELKCGEPLLDVILWGIEPLQHLAFMLTEEIQENYDSNHPEESEHLHFIGWEIQKYVDELKETLERFSGQITEFVECMAKNGKASKEDDHE